MPSVQASAQPVARRESDCNCGRCGEGVYFVEGVVGPERWQHCRTNQSRCAPICAECGEPAAFQIGGDYVGGDGAFGFRRSKWVCRAHAGNQLYIDRI